MKMTYLPTQVMRDTSFLQDLYSDDELSAEKDRDGKMKFLQKLIDVISECHRQIIPHTRPSNFYRFSEIVTKQDLQVKTSKIVAGLEADRTNELFQAIAYALDNKLDSTEAVISVKSGGGGAAVQSTKSKAPKTEQKTKPVVKVISKQPPPSRDRTPAKPEPKKQLTSQKSIEKKNPVREKTTLKEKPSSKAKPNVNDARKVKKAPSKDSDSMSSLKIEEKILTNGSHENHSITPPLTKQNSLERKNEEHEIENHQEVQQQQQQQESAEDRKENEEPKVNGDANHVIESNGHAEIEREPEVQKPQDELAAIIDEEAEYRRKEKSTKRLSSRHRQKSVENESQEKQQQQQHDAQQAVNENGKLPQEEKIERFKSTYKRESMDRPRTSLRPPSARPASSRPAAPRRRDKNVEIVLQTEENVKLGNIQVKMENFSKELEDDGENLVIIEDPSASNDDTTNFLNERLSKNASSDSNEMPSDHGVLVQQILETEKNFEGALGMDASEQVKKTEIVR
jgi:TRAF3-interacting protein 1